MNDSIHKKLNRVRKPRVHITYDVEAEGALVQRELPFIAGVMADLTGNNPSIKQASFKEPKFVNIDNENFSDVMAKMGPGTSFRVENILTNDNSELPVQLQFKSMDDFEPANIVKQVEPLKKLLDIRSKLREFLSKADRSEKLEELLEQLLMDKNSLNHSMLKNYSKLSVLSLK